MATFGAPIGVDCPDQNAFRSCVAQVAQYSKHVHVDHFARHSDKWLAGAMVEEYGRAVELVAIIDLAGACSSTIIPSQHQVTRTARQCPCKNKANSVVMFFLSCKVHKM